MGSFTESTKRRHPRFDVSAVHGVLSTLVEARLCDWSPNGLSFESAYALAPGQSLVLRLRDRSSSSPLRGRVAWSTLTGSRRDGLGDLQPVYRSGIELEPLSPRQAREILAAFDGLAGGDWEERRPGRFSAPQPVPIVLELEYEMTVRRLSRGGLLLETAMAPDLDSHIVLRMELGDRRVRSRGRVAYRGDGHPAGHRRTLEVGIELLDMPEKDEHALGSYLEDLAARNLPAVEISPVTA